MPSRAKKLDRTVSRPATRRTNSYGSRCATSPPIGQRFGAVWLAPTKQLTGVKPRTTGRRGDEPVRDPLRRPLQRGRLTPLVHRYVTEETMPSGRMPEGPAALSNAERQARHRAKMLAVQPRLATQRPATAARRKSPRSGWNDALAAMHRGPGRMRRLVRSRPTDRAEPRARWLVAPDGTVCVDT